MARALGVRSDWVDAATFGLGSGIAGVAGVALSQLTNVGPNLGQSYIIDSFMVVVFGGVGNLWGTLISGLSLGVVNKVLEPYAGAVLGKIFVLVALILFIQRRPRGLFPQTGRAARERDGRYSALACPREVTTPAARLFVGLLLIVAVLTPVLNLAVPASSPFHVSTFVMTLVGKYLCYAMLALAVDLVWGYCGILSLGHGAFFALGGLCDGHVPDAADWTARRSTGNPILPGLHGVPQLEGAAVVLARIQSLSPTRCS
jgi:ABC-type branched-subunit amino acid transport system permease subunit